MVTSAELAALAPTLAPPNDEILARAASYLHTFEAGLDQRYSLETAHNLVTDVVTNLVLQNQAPSDVLILYEEVLYAARIEFYGAVGRPADMTAPYWRP